MRPMDSTKEQVRHPGAKGKWGENKAKVAALDATGQLNTRQIAAALGISMRMVRMHRHDNREASDER